MGRWLDLPGFLGKRFGRLVVRFIVPGKRKLACDCDCGSVNVVVTGSALKRGNNKSCGCLYREARRAKKTQHAGLNAYLRSYKSNARTRGYDFRLTTEQFAALIVRPCAYCGSSPRERNWAVGCAVYGNGIDRLDSKLGYIESNVTTCCSICNIAKRDRTVGEFLAWVRKVAEFQGESCA